MQKKAAAEKEVMTWEELAEFLRVSTDTLFYWQRTGREMPPAIQLTSRKKVFLRASVMDWLASREAPCQASEISKAIGEKGGRSRSPKPGQRRGRKSIAQQRAERKEGLEAGLRK